MIVVFPGLAQASLDRLALGFGEVLEDVSFFVAHAALHRDFIAAHLANCLAQRLGPVDHEQHALFGV